MGPTVGPKNMGAGYKGVSPPRGKNPGKGHPERGSTNISGE